MLAHNVLFFGRRWRIEHISDISARLHGLFLFSRMLQKWWLEMKRSCILKKIGRALNKYLREVNGVAIHRSMVPHCFCEIKNCVARGTPAAKTVFRVYTDEEHMLRHSSCVRSINRLTVLRR